MEKRLAGVCLRRAVAAFKRFLLTCRGKPPLDSLLACVWSKWIAIVQSDFLSFPLITDELRQITTPRIHRFHAKGSDKKTLVTDKGFW